MTDGEAGGIAALIEATAADLAAVDRRAIAGGAEWSTGGIVFAAVSGDRAEFRLAPPVVARGPQDARHLRLRSRGGLGRVRAQGDGRPCDRSGGSVARERVAPGRR